MTTPTDDRRLLRLLAVLLTALWAIAAFVIASAYRPGGPVDIIVVFACFVPVAIADAGVVWPAQPAGRRARTALVWVWIAAVLFTIPVVYGVAVTLGDDGPRSLLPSVEAAYGGAIALFASAFFSVAGVVHQHRGERPLERRASWVTAGLAAVLTLVAGLTFVFVAAVNVTDVRRGEPVVSRFGPTGVEVEPPFCDAGVALGANARVVIKAGSSVDNVDRGTARMEGRRSGRDEAWAGSWEGPDGSGAQAYLRVADEAWRNGRSDDLEAPGSLWEPVEPDVFGLAGDDGLTMDDPPRFVVDAPRGDIVAEDLGLELVEGAQARHCRTFVDGTTALDTFLPLRWLLYGSNAHPAGPIERWRGELDWWVFSDGQLGMAAVEVSGSRAETPWDAVGARAVLKAELSATNRSRPARIKAPVEADDEAGGTLESEGT